MHNIITRFIKFVSVDLSSKYIGIVIVRILIDSTAAIMTDVIIIDNIVTRSEIHIIMALTRSLKVLYLV